MTTPTQRTYTDAETGYNCRLHTSNDASKFHLIYEGQGEKIADGCEVNGFYISAHTGAEIKLNTGKKIFVDRCNFYNLKEGEKVTHRKFIGFKKFTKI
jgi:hypothetical protein